MRVWIVIGLCLGSWLTPLRAGDPPRPAVGTTIAPFSLRDVQGKTHALEQWKDAKAIVLLFLGVDCPINNAYGPTIQQLHTRYAPRGVVFLGVNSNSHEDADRVAEHARQQKFAFPVAKDYRNVLADTVGALRTPEVVVLDATGTIRYRGRIDDRLGFTRQGQSFQRPKPLREDLAIALDELLSGKPVSVPETTCDGCRIGRERVAQTNAEVTYSNRVAAILQQHCVSCHRPGQLAPFSLLTYAQARGWGEMIREVVQDRRMPPWHADPAHGKFRNDRSMPAEDIRDLIQWVDAGMPAGDLAKVPTPPPYASGWSIGQPDRIYEMPQPFRVPAQGEVKYQWIRIDPQLKEDQWVQAIEIRPGNPAVVHHVLMFLLPPGARRLDEDREAGFFAAYAPGHNPSIFPKGQGKKMPKGSTILLQMHYTPNGVETTDQTRIGIVLAKEPVQREVHTIGVFNNRFLLPPGEANIEVRAAHRLSQDVELLALMPHTHLRGKSFRYEAKFPDGRTEVILNVPRYDFNWQTAYELEKPIRLPKNSELVCVAVYDNSANNPNNPDPSKAVKWGPQTWDEMMIGYFDYLPVTGKPERVGGVDGQANRKRMFEALFKTLDKNQDGFITQDEVPAAYRSMFQRWLDRYDQDNDGKLSRKDLLLEE